jgi:hypothetical protein
MFRAGFKRDRREAPHATPLRGDLTALTEPYGALPRKCSFIYSFTSAWESNIALKLTSYEEALATDRIVASWISFAQNAALGAHTYILEDGSWLIAVYGPHADEGGEVLEGMYAQGCTSIEDSRIRGRSGRAGGVDTGSGAG